MVSVPVAIAELAELVEVVELVDEDGSNRLFASSGWDSVGIGKWAGLSVQDL